MILQIVGAESEAYWEVPEPVLRGCLNIGDLKAREARLREHLKPTRVHSSTEVQVVLVLDGDEDAESWEEYRESL